MKIKGLVSTLDLFFCVKNLFFSRFLYIFAKNMIYYGYKQKFQRKCNIIMG